MKFHTYMDFEQRERDDSNINFEFSGYYLDEDVQKSSPVPMPAYERIDNSLGLDYAENHLFSINKESQTSDSIKEVANCSIEMNSYLNSLLIPTHKHRMGKQMQSKIQKIIKFFTKAHICKNLPAQIFRKIKNYLKKIGREDQLEDGIKRYNVEELNQFIQSSGLTQYQWDEILQLESIYAAIDKSKKLGTSKHFNGITQHRRSFLIELNKKVQKIVYRSAKRVISQLLMGVEFMGYLDKTAHKELCELDIECSKCPKYSTEYQSILLLLNEHVRQKAFGSEYNYSVLIQKY